jgi:hypothetical protein
VSLLVSEPLSWFDSLQPIQIDRRMRRDDRTVLRTNWFRWTEPTFVFGVRIA